MLSELYEDLRGLIESPAKKESYAWPPIKVRRNDAVKRHYTEAKQRIAESSSHGVKTRVSIHRDTIHAITVPTVLTKGQIETIVGVKEEILRGLDLDQRWRDDAKEKGCTCEPTMTGRWREEKVKSRSVPRSHRVRRAQAGPPAGMCARPGGR